MKIHKDDTILVISGKYKGKKGKVLRCFPKDKKVMIQGVNLKKKHQKPKKKGEKGEIVQIPAPFDVSNVKFICSKCLKATRIAYKSKAKGKEKVRICKKCNREA